MLRPILFKTFLLMTVTFATGWTSLSHAQTLSGDYDLYVMVGAAPNGGFEARPRMRFAVCKWRVVQASQRRSSFYEWP